MPCARPTGGVVRSARVRRDRKPSVKVRRIMLRESNEARSTDDTGAPAIEPSVDLDAIVRALIEAVPGAAFVASKEGNVVYANASGKRMLASNRSRTTSELADAIESGNPSWDVKRIGGGGQREHHLLVHRDDSHRLASRLSAAVARWKLSRRQAEVLALVVDGHSNASIGMILGIATRTVEVHVSALLDRVQVENRSALVARVLSA